MPKIDFSKIDDVKDYTPIPEGEYRCAVDEVEAKYSQAGDDLWAIRWCVEEGEYEGRYVFDNLAFSPKALPRVKLMCDALGLDVSSEVDLEPEAILDRKCLVTVIVRQYTDDDGKEKACNGVTFDGYAPLSTSEDGDGDDVSF